jgi:hypothetical protein
MSAYRVFDNGKEEDNYTVAIQQTIIRVSEENREETDNSID